MDRDKIEKGSSTVIPNASREFPNADLPDVYNNGYRSLRVKSPLGRNLSKVSAQGSKTSLENYDGVILKLPIKQSGKNKVYSKFVPK
jgi:hypothetical protein